MPTRIQPNPHPRRPLLSFSGRSITITGAKGHVIDGNGPKWWDGQGSNGGKTKPKFFYAHSLTVTPLLLSSPIPS